MSNDKKVGPPWQKRLYTVIFEAETPAGRLFDILLIGAILLSVATVCLESMKEIKAEYGQQLYLLELTFTALFSLEYLLRILSLRRPLSYIFSFYGIVDLLSILPTFLTPIVSGAS